MRCDLHVHSYYSGMCEVPGLNRVCRECYSAPAEVYATLRSRGMDLVTLTDHDSIEGAEELRRFSGFFLSEEVTCRMPSGTQVHVGVYDITERDHVEIQRRRNDLPRLLAYVNERRLFFSVNHLFSGLTGRRALEDFDWFESMFPAYETRNGHMLQGHNRSAEEVAQRLGKAAIGGSDAHALASAGSAYTEVPGARTKTEFLRGLRAGRGRPGGESGSYGKLTRDVFLIAGAMLRHNPWSSFLLPLAPAIPIYTLAVMLHEFGFARRWSELALRRERVRPQPERRRGTPAHLGPQEALAWR
ncbi:MAG TPA: PHP domain-containing protein [Candidatus Acidoferrales bacterium]|nr:PHP domain-containing protein [Candidatus Acidoferrales bacterium]